MFGINTIIIYCLAVIICLLSNNITCLHENITYLINCVIFFYGGFFEFFYSCLPLFHDNLVKLFEWFSCLHESSYKNILFLDKIGVKFIFSYLYLFVFSVIEYYFNYDYNYLYFSEYILVNDNIFNSITSNMEGFTEDNEKNTDSAGIEKPSSNFGGGSSNNGDDESDNQDEIPDECWNWKEDSSNNDDDDNDLKKTALDKGKGVDRGMDDEGKGLDTSMDKGKGVDRTIPPIASESPVYYVDSDDEISALDEKRKELEAQQLKYWKSLMLQQSDKQSIEKQSAYQLPISDWDYQLDSDSDLESDQELEKYQTNTVNSEDDEQTKKEKIRLQQLDQQLKLEKIELDKKEAAKEATKTLENSDPWEESSKAGEKRALEYYDKQDKQEDSSRTKRRK